MKIPEHLSSPTATGVQEGEPIAQFEIGSYRNFIYLILDWESKKAAIIDPQADLSPPLESLQKHGFELAAVLLTHTHFDHVAGVPELMTRYPHLPVYVHRADAHRFSKQDALRQSAFQLLEDGAVVRVGTLNVKLIHTPGHSAGECCYYLEPTATMPPYLITGDTIFIRDCGRTDLETGSNAEMFQSLQKIKKLPATAVILPGHHYREECASTLGQELAESPPFQCESVEELANLP